MIGLDTNVLLRYLTDDDDSQKAAAERFIHRCASRGEPLFVNQIVLCEMTWVLARAYGLSRLRIADLIADLLMTRHLEFEAKETVVAALHDFRGGKADFADCLVGAKNRAAGCSATATFDRAAAALSTFLMVK